MSKTVLPKILFRDADYLIISNSSVSLSSTFSKKNLEALTIDEKKPFRNLLNVGQDHLAKNLLGGVTMFARNKESLDAARDRLLQGNFWRRNFQVALRSSPLILSEREGHIKIPLLPKRRFYFPNPTGFNASTRWKLLKTGISKEGEKICLLDMETMDGLLPANAQIRAHSFFGLKQMVIGDYPNGWDNPEMKKIGYFALKPVLQKDCYPLMIYCSKLAFATTGGEKVELKSSPPDELRDFYLEQGWAMEEDSMDIGIEEVTEVWKKVAKKKVAKDLFADLA